MKLTTNVVCVALLMLAGCAVTTQLNDIPAEQPELISMASLPPLTSAMHVDGVKLNLLLHVMQDGAVENVKMLGSSGDPAWDVLAVQAIKQWKFSAMRRDGVPVNVWFRQLIIVQVQEPVVMTIGELVCRSKQEADSLYTLIESGSAMDELFKLVDGSIDIMKYPKRVRDEVRRLEEGDVTHPIRVGETYVIYKRFPKNTIKPVS